MTAEMVETVGPTNGSNDMDRIELVDDRSHDLRHPGGPAWLEQEAHPGRAFDAIRAASSETR